MQRKQKVELILSFFFQSFLFAIREKKIEQIEFWKVGEEL